MRFEELVGSVHWPTNSLLHRDEGTRESPTLSQIILIPFVGCKRNGLLLSNVGMPGPVKQPAHHLQLVQQQLFVTAAHRELLNYRLTSEGMRTGQQEKPEVKRSVTTKDAAGSPYAALELL